MLPFILQAWWMLFLLCLLLFMLTTLWMSKVATGFYITSRKFRFGIFDLEFPVSEYSLDTMVSAMNGGERKKVRWHLLIDYLFMPAAYTGIALLCIKTADKMTSIGKYVFWILAAIQVIAWLCDILENGYLLRKLKTVTTVQSNPDENSSAYERFQLLVKIKFALALTGAVCSVFGLLYFWIVGAYSKDSLPNIATAFVAIILFVLIGKAIKKKPKLAEGGS